MPTKTAKTCIVRIVDNIRLSKHTNPLISTLFTTGTKYDEHFGHKSGHKTGKMDKKEGYRAKKILFFASKNFFIEKSYKTIDR